LPGKLPNWTCGYGPRRRRAGDRRLRRAADLVSIQLLDGIGAGIFGALFFIVIADLTRGTGHYNLALGAASAAWGMGAALSNFVAGFIVDQVSFNGAFLFLAAMASLAFLLFWLAVPETGEGGKSVEAEMDAQESRNAPALGLARQRAAAK
jgi:MFS family permease